MTMRHVNVTKKILFFCISISTASLTGASSASAQLFFSRIPPGEIVSLVRSRGYYDVAYPYYRGDIYVVDATERRGMRVRLVVDPRSGEIVERLVIGRDRRVYPVGPAIAAPLGVERPVLDNDRESRSTVQIEEPRRKSKQRAKRREPVIETAPADIAPIPQLLPAAPQAEPESSVQIVPTAPRTRQPSRQSVVPSEPVEPVQRGGQATEVPVVSSPAISAPTAPPPKPPGPVIAAPGPTERGTKDNPRKVGPIVPPPVGLE